MNRNSLMTTYDETRKTCCYFARDVLGTLTALSYLTSTALVTLDGFGLVDHNLNLAKIGSVLLLIGVPTFAGLQRYSAGAVKIADERDASTQAAYQAAH